MKGYKPLLTQIAVDLLHGLYVDDPTLTQIAAAESLIKTMFDQQKEVCSERLQPKEWWCLYWASQGKSIKETAHILNISMAAVKMYRIRVKEKLQCKRLANAIYRLSMEENIYVMAKK
jgi:DNA-binding CsgD family transcriptional regulator